MQWLLLHQQTIQLLHQLMRIGNNRRNPLSLIHLPLQPLLLSHMQRQQRLLNAAAAASVVAADAAAAANAAAAVAVAGYLHLFLIPLLRHQPQPLLQQQWQQHQLQLQHRRSAACLDSEWAQPGPARPTYWQWYCAVQRRPTTGLQLLHRHWTAITALGRYGCTLTSFIIMIMIQAG